MSATVFFKLLSIVFVVALGWGAGRLKWLAAGGQTAADPARTLSNAALYLFIPALLFRTTARIDFASLPCARWRRFSCPF